MSFPPKKPLKDTQSYFEYIITKVSPYFTQLGIELDFTGMDELIKEFEDVDFKNIGGSYDLAVKSASWIDYLISMKAIAYEELQNLETDKMAKLAMASFKADNNKVANGDRLANMDKEVIDVRRKRNEIETFYNLVCDKIDFLEKMHYLCKSSCEWNTRGRKDNNE